MIAVIGAWLAKSALMQSPIGRILKAIPRSVWIAIAVLAAVLALVLWHRHEVSQARKDGYDAGVAAERAEADKKAREWAARIDKLTGRISAKLKEKNDAENRAIAARADALRLSGPGRAICPGRAQVSSSAGRSEPGGGTGGASGPAVPADQWAAVPWGWLVGTAERCDLNRAEVLTWREWYRQQSEAWSKAAEASR